MIRPAKPEPSTQTFILRWIRQGGSRWPGGGRPFDSWTVRSQLMGFLYQPGRLQQPNTRKLPLVGSMSVDKRARASFLAGSAVRNYETKHIHFGACSRYSWANETDGSRKKSRLSVSGHSYSLPCTSLTLTTISPLELCYLRLLRLA